MTQKDKSRTEAGAPRRAACRRGWRPWAAVLLLAAVVSADAATEFPPLSGRVMDRAGLLSESARAELTQLLAEHERRTSNQVVVLTVDSLQGRPIADYGHRLMRLWRLGEKERDNGVILIVAPNERRVRIAVGYGLEGVLNETLIQQIKQAQLLPYFRDGDYERGIQEGTRAIVQALEGTYRPTVPEANKAEHIIPLLVAALLAFIGFSGFLGSFIGAAGHRGGRAESGAQEAEASPLAGGAYGNW